MRWLIRGFEYGLFTMLAIIQLKSHQNTDYKKILFQEGNFDRKEQLLAKKLPHNLHANDLVHWVILPMVNESHELIEETLSNLQKSSYPLDRIAITIA